MANQVRIELNSEGIKDLLKSDGMARACEAAARQYLSRLPAGYKLSVYNGRNRVNVSVYTGNKKAYKDNLDNNTMLKNL